MIRILSVLGILVLLSACADPTRDLSQPVEPMGDFKLGFSEVVAPNLQKLLVSRDATAEELTTQLDAAMEQQKAAARAAWKGSGQSASEEVWFDPFSRFIAWVKFITKRSNDVTASFQSPSR